MLETLVFTWGLLLIEGITVSRENMEEGCYFMTNMERNSIEVKKKKTELRGLGKQ